MNVQRKFVQFFGGPLDGHRQDITDREKSLPTLLQLEVGPNTFCLLAKKMPTSDVSTTSVAVYQLTMVNGEVRYCFVMARKPTKWRTAGR